MTVKDYMVYTALQIANDNSYGYSNRWPDNKFGEGNDPKNGDCGAFNSHCLNLALAQIGVKESRYYEPIGNYQLYNEEYLLKYCDRYAYADIRNAPGDILTNKGHTVMVTSIDPDMITHARNDDDGVSGDWTTGREILTQRLYDGDWKWIFRLKPKYNLPIPVPEPDPEPEPESDEKKEEEKEMFSDVNEKTSGYAAIKWCYENGIVKGFKDGTFRPTEPPTRAGVCIIVYRLFKLLYKLLKK